MVTLTLWNSTLEPMFLSNSVGIGIYCLTEVQEAQEEWVRCQIIRGHTTSG